MTKEYGIAEAVLDFIFVFSAGGVFFITLLTFGKGEIKFYQFLGFVPGLFICLLLLRKVSRLGYKLLDKIKEKRKPRPSP